MRLLVSALLLASCGTSDVADPTPADAAAQDVVPDPVDSSAPAPACVLRVEADAQAAQAIVAAGASCPIEVVHGESEVLEVWLEAAAALTVEGLVTDEPGWARPRIYSADDHLGAVSHMGDEGLEVSLHVRRYEPPVQVDIDRSLVWTDEPLVSLCGLDCLMGVASDDGHGGALLQRWFQRFATTDHSERLGPTLLLDAYAQVLGPAAETWDLSLLPFKVTAVHNRLDLATDEHCGELRVSLASIDPEHRPFHLIFLFRQAPRPADISPGGAVHCTATAYEWAGLSVLTGDALLAAAQAVIAEGLTHERFLLAESTEFIVAPWEWRQWFAQAEAGVRVFENRPLFQTIDIPGLNAPGELRDDFLKWVADNAAAIDARQLLIPDAFRAPSARINQGVPWVPLDLSGLPADVAQAHPTLRQSLEMVGCPACHTADAEFIQTTEERTFSPFYETELDARAEHLTARLTDTPPTVPFGPLQADPVTH